MKTFSFYDKTTGRFTGAAFSSTARNIEQVLAANMREGCAAIEGRYDHRMQRVDLDTGRVVDDPELAQSSALETERENRLQELERAANARVRELMAASDPKLRELDAQIAQLRGE